MDIKQEEVEEKDSKPEVGFIWSIMFDKNEKIFGS
jgi:hypothetical protein